MGEFEKKQKSIADNVKRLIAEHPEIKEDYRLLIHYYHYYIDGLKSFVPLSALRSTTQPESISRAFRKLAAEGEVKLIAEVQAARRIEERAFRKYYNARQGAKEGD